MGRINSYLIGLFIIYFFNLNIYIFFWLSAKVAFAAATLAGAAVTGSLQNSIQVEQHSPPPFSLSLTLLCTLTRCCTSTAGEHLHSPQCSGLFSLALHALSKLFEASFFFFCSTPTATLLLTVFIFFLSPIYRFTVASQSLLACHWDPF